jgi:aldehyde dehydrogenase (NAD+)
MQEEIFGPVFPMIAFSESAGESFLQQVISFIKRREKPLALYWFGDEKNGWEVIRNTSSGGACINDVIMHIANDNLPFGGVGNSGMGRYHHRHSFECFTHTRSILVSPPSTDMPLRYMPYNFFRWIKRII